MTASRMVISFLAYAIQVAFATGQPPTVPDASQEEARFLLQQALSAREAVRTGQVQITGRYQYTTYEGDAGFEGPVSGLYVFDREANVYRYDGEWPCKARINLPGTYTVAAPDASTPTNQVKYGFCRSVEYFADWSQIAPHVASDIHLRNLSDEEANRSFGCGRRPLDVMAFGMFEHHNIGQGTEMPRMYALMLELPEKRVLSTAGGVTNLKVGGERWSCRIDMDRALSAPLHLEEDNPPILFKTDTEWTERDGVAIPVKYSTFKRISSAAEVAAEETMELALEWLLVNEDIPDSEFEYTAFTGVPPRLLEVIDVRGDEPEHLGRWVADGGVLEPLAANQMPSPKRQPGPPLAPSASQSRLWGLYVINGLFLALLIAVWWWRRHAKTGSQA